MPKQVGAADIMGEMGMNATLTAGVMGANANRELTADTVTSENKFKKLGAKQGILDTNLEVLNALRSQKLTDSWGAYQGKQAAYTSLTSGISSGVGGFLGNGGGSSIVSGLSSLAGLFTGGAKA
jgi:hypothetical protein